jgi:hypothetical protein
MNDGIIVTCAGSIIVASNMTNATDRPGQRSARERVGDEGAAEQRPQRREHDENQTVADVPEERHRAERACVVELHLPPYRLQRRARTNDQAQHATIRATAGRRHLPFAEITRARHRHPHAVLKRLIVKRRRLEHDVARAVLRNVGRALRLPRVAADRKRRVDAMPTVVGQVADQDLVELVRRRRRLVFETEHDGRIR